MGNRKTGKNFICPNCSKVFYVQLNRLKKQTNHYCSLKCTTQYTVDERVKKYRKKEYPFVKGSCFYYKGDIIIRNSGFDKPNRKFCSMSCRTAWRNKNVPQTETQRKLSSKRMKLIFTGYKRSEENKLKVALANIGAKSHFWKGGFVALARRLRNSNKAVEWRKLVFERDDYTCQKCSKRNGQGYSVYLEADHIIPFSVLFNNFIMDATEKDEDKLYEAALLEPKLWDIANGRTLCRECHRITTTFSYRANEFVLSQNGKGIYNKINDDIVAEEK